MDISSLLTTFLASPHGQQAASALQAQGFNPNDVQQILNHSVSAGQEHVDAAAPPHHTGLSFLSAFASGLVKGDGVFGSLEDGAAGVIETRIVAKLTGNMGMNSAAASAAAAAAAPYVLSFLREHLRL
jgi:hypothetical protein